MEKWRKDARRAAMRTAQKELGRRKLVDRQKRRQWTASCRLDREEMEELIAICEEQGTTRYAVIKAMILEYMEARR